MGEIESSSSNEGGLPKEATSTLTGDASVGDEATTVIPEAPKVPAKKRPLAAKKSVSEEASGRPDLTKVAERRAASRNKRIKRAKEEA